MGASPDTRSPPPPLPTAPPDTLLTHSSILENTGALEQRHVDVMERVGGGWVGGLAEPEDGAAEAAASELDGGPASWRTVQPRGRRRCRTSP